MTQMTQMTQIFEFLKRHCRRLVLAETLATGCIMMCILIQARGPLS